jgi:Acyl-coenzyme A:6-aminopenicillanic acid acyl-transferase
VARVRLQEHTIAEPKPAVFIRHLTIRGSNVEIGRVIAHLATTQHHVTPEQLVSDARFVRARRRTFEHGYPIHARRMRGVAAAFGLRPDDDRFDFSILATSPEICGQPLRDAFTSYSPPWTTDRGHGVLRWTGSLPRGACVMEWRPSGRTYASLALHAFDLLSGTVVGINGAGLVASAVAAEPAPLSIHSRSGARAWPAQAVGLHELALLRLLLDTCTTVDEAQATLLDAPAFRMFVAVRYLIADQTGRSFTYEATGDRSAQRIVEGGAEPMVLVTGTGPMGDPMRVTSAGGSTTTGQTHGAVRPGTRAGRAPRPGPDRHVHAAAHPAVTAEQQWDCLLDQDRGDLEVRLAGDGVISGACIVAAALPRP